MRNRKIAKSTQRAVIGRLPKLRKIIYAPVDGPRQHIGATCSMPHATCPMHHAPVKVAGAQAYIAYSIYRKLATGKRDQRVGC